MPPLPLQDEASRLAALEAYEILDTAPEEPFEKITRLVQALVGVPIATVTFVDRDRQWFKSRQGLDESETERRISFCNYTIQSANPLVVPNASADARFRDSPLVLGSPFIASYLGIPLVTRDGFALGALCAMDVSPREFADGQIDIMSNLASLVLDWLEMRRIAHSDFLTGAMTRRAFLAEMEKEMVRDRRYGRPSALAMFDIDHFKSINDTYGHPAGDELLRAVSVACHSILRSGDLLGRLGGEEFALLLPETDAGEALQAAERFRRAIAAIALPALPEIAATASFGLAPLSLSHDDPEGWLAAADAELYRAKRSGRNRCCMAEA